jgi:hypothetical protein
VGEKTERGVPARYEAKVRKKEIAAMEMQNKKK